MSQSSIAFYTEIFMKINILAYSFMLLFISLKSNIPTIGDIAPDFNLQDENGIWHSLHQYKDKKIILCFSPKGAHGNYPRDPKWLGLKYASRLDALRLVNRDTILLIGIDYESSKSNNQFKNKHVNFPFTLLSDQDGNVSKCYGVNKFFNFSPRKMTFVIENNCIKQVFPGNNILDFTKDILKTFNLPIPRMLYFD